MPPFELRRGGVPTTAAEVDEGAGELGTGRLALAARWDGMPGRSDLVALVLVATEGDEAGLGVLVPARPARCRHGGQEAQRVLARPVVGHQVKEVMRSLLPLGIDLTGLVMDTGVAAYLLDASTGEYELVAAARADGPAEPRHRRAGRDRAGLGTEAAGEAADVAGMAAGFRHRIDAEDMVMLHDDIETPLVRVLAKMEVAGIGVDRAELQAIADALKDVGGHAPGRGAGAGRPRVQRRTRRRSCAPCSTTSSASRRARRPRPATRPTPRRSRACAASTRSSRRCSPTARWRSCARPTARACWPRWPPDGRIHASFGQTVARTGRISSDRPNLHNIPVRTELGKQFRRAFVPAEGSTFLVADYDQVELRVHRPPLGGPGADRGA